MYDFMESSAMHSSLSMDPQLHISDIKYSSQSKKSYEWPLPILEEYKMVN